MANGGGVLYGCVEGTLSGLAVGYGKDSVGRVVHRRRLVRIEVGLESEHLADSLPPPRHFANFVQRHRSQDAADKTCQAESCHRHAIRKRHLVP